MGRERLSGETANRRHEKKREGQSMGGVMNSYRSVAEIEMDNSESGRGRGADRRGKRHIRAGEDAERGEPVMYQLIFVTGH